MKIIYVKEPPAYVYEQSCGGNQWSHHPPSGN